MDKKKVILFCIVRYFALFGMLFCMSSFYIGYHNVDIGYNFKTLNIYDKGSDGVVRSPDEIYRLGMNQMIRGFVWFGIFGILFGMTETFK